MMHQSENRRGQAKYQSGKSTWKRNNRHTHNTSSRVPRCGRGTYLISFAPRAPQKYVRSSGGGCGCGCGGTGTLDDMLRCESAVYSAALCSTHGTTALRFTDERGQHTCGHCGVINIGQCIGIDMCGLRVMIVVVQWSLVLVAVGAAMLVSGMALGGGFWPW